MISIWVIELFFPRDKILTIWLFVLLLEFMFYIIVNHLLILLNIGIASSWLILFLITVSFNKTLLFGC